MDGIVVKALVFGGIVLVIALVVRAADRQKQRVDASVARAAAGTATIVAVAGNDSSRRTTAGVASGYDVTLDVALPDRAPYRVTVPWYVRPLAAPLVQPGATIAVTVDPRSDELVRADHDDVDLDPTFEVGVLDRLDDPDR